MTKIYVTESSIPNFDEYIEEIKPIFDNKRLTNMAEKHRKLQEQLEDYLGVSHVALFTNGHLALENAIEFFNFKKGSEIITTPFTFVSTTHAIVRCGMKPVFCDINKDDYTIDVTKIEELITDKTIAILPVHVYGNICNIEEIEKIAKKHNLKVIYDAAHAFGVKYKGKSVANFGDLSMFSFHATKVFNTIEGGCLSFNDDSKETILKDLKNFGIHGPESVEYIGGNAKMSEFQAAMGICNLRHVDEWIKQRKELVEYYNSKLSNIDGIKLCNIQNDVESNYAYYPVVFDGYKYNRDEIFKRLADNDIYARKYFYPLTCDCNCYKDFYANVSVARDIASKVLTLPIYPNLSKEDIDRICKIIKE